jgi:O-antigen/teichoic acid export membrane protein
VWALVAQRLVSASITVLASWHALRWIPRGRFAWPQFRTLVGFGGFVTGSNLILQINTRIAELMCGFLAGPAAVSLIRAGSRFMEIVNQLTFAPLQQISMPVQSRAQDDRAQRLANYLAMSRLSALVMFPAYLGCFAIAHPLVNTVFGPQWREAAYAIQILALSVLPLQLNVLTIGNVNAAGASRIVFLWALAQVAVGLSAVYFAWPFGWKAMLMANVARSYLLLPLALLMLRRTMGITLRQIAGSIAPALVAALAMVAGVMGCGAVLAPHLRDVVLLFTLPPIGAVIYAAVLAILNPAAFRTVTGLVRQRLRPA